MNDENQNIIPATTHKWAGSTQDGTMRLVIEIEPRDATRAMQLFGTEPGIPIAIARIENGNG